MSATTTDPIDIVANAILDVNRLEMGEILRYWDIEATEEELRGLAIHLAMNVLDDGFIHDEVRYISESRADEEADNE